MATKEDQETLRLLVQYVSRAFYEPKFVVIMDQLARHPVLKDDDLAGRIGLQAKELNKIMAVLSNDRLVQVHRQNELKEGAQRSIGKQYYFIDYQLLCNVVKWRVSEMRRIIDSTLRNELDNKGYICPNCKATFSPLEADRLMDFMLGTFVCDQCPTSPGGPHEVVLNEDEETVRGSKDRMERFNRQTKFIREGLRKSEAMTLPAFDVAIWIKNNVSEAEKQKQAQGGGLKIAGADGKREEQSISVLMSVDKDEATRRQEREAEADAKRQQNLLPSWHLKSTISNDLTALGIAAVNQQSTNGKPTGNEAILSSLGKNGSSNADILNGLGKVKPQPKVEQPDIINLVEEEKKPVVDHNADFYEQYYASLEAASQARSTTQTPVMESFGSDFDEEERKPNVAYLDTLNAVRKRSRSLEDDGGRDNKALRSNQGTPVFSQSASGLSSAVDSPLLLPESVPSQADVEGHAELVGFGTPAVDEPIVLVGGQPMPFSAVTQELADEKMSPEEYTAWYELVMVQ
ncbi:TFIIE alpha subunit-domain-containing protein [Phellopilus nigrolimitatus]|nr:TFIIE alpha subunit-domain-containing protein [Phellopilus nigrolimitatus]